MTVSKYQKDTITERCHWIAYTVPFYKDQLWPNFISASGKEIRPIAHFTNGLEISNGGRVYWNERRPNMGRHVIFSGSCCDTIGENLKECLSFIRDNQFKVTRLDLAIDVHNTNLSISHMQSIVRRKVFKSHATVAPHIEDLLGRGNTVQLGTSSSACYLTVYDKAAEQKVEGTWVRAEIKYGARKAKAALDAYLQTDDIRSMVCDYVSFPTWRKWNALLGIQKTPVRYEVKETNTRKWLLGVVAKSIAKEMLFDDGEKFRELLLSQIKIEYNILTSEKEVIDF